MSRVLWIAADLVRDARARGPSLWLGLSLMLWWPVQMALIDGGAARSFLWQRTGGFRHSIVMSAAWPALGMIGFLAEVVLPRRLGGEMEPIAASPVSTGAIASACLLPGCLVTIVHPFLAFPLALGGYRLGAGATDPDAGAWLLHSVLATHVCGLWLAVPGVAALFAARSHADFMLRSLAGYAALAILDALLLALRVTGHASLSIPVLAGALLGGAAALGITLRALDREGLALRR